MIQTVSLETAKLLKEEGFPQETALFYRVDEFGNVFERNANEDPLKMQKVLGTNIYYAKPTTDELLEELPREIRHKEAREIQPLRIYFGRKDLSVEYHLAFTLALHICQHKELPEALAQMWLWLKKENLLK